MNIDFLKVLPVEIGRHGADAACVLALIRYMTALPGERNGRRLIDGHIWWTATYADIGQAIGLDRQKVGRAVRKLEDDQALLGSFTDAFKGNQTKAYRLPADQQNSNLNEPDQQNSNLNHGRSNMNHGEFKYEPPKFKYELSIPSIEELEEKREVTGQVVSGSQGRPSASMTRVSKKLRPCLAAVDR